MIWVWVVLGAAAVLGTTSLVTELIIAHTLRKQRPTGKVIIPIT